ncbi:MAG TPA: ATPase, T2SS/T4P/T4SS family, partial [Chroococcales cyanobacterium]
MTIAMKYDALGELAVRLKLLSSQALSQAVSLSNGKETSLAQLIASADLAKLDKMHDVLHLQLRMAEGELLVQFLLISRDQLEAALLVSEDLRHSLSSTLLKQGVLRPTHLVAVFDELQGMDFSDLNQSLIDPVFAELIPRSVSARFGILALARINNRTLVATPHPENIPAIDDLQILTGGRVIPVKTTEASVAAFWKSFNFEGVHLNAIMEVPEEDVSVADLAADAAEAPVIRLVNELLATAITNLVSDIHIEPKEKDVAVRYRKDGILAEATRFPKATQSAAIARLKIMSNLDVSEKRLPQDGKIRVRVADNMVDLRVSTMPSQYGEKIVIRVLNRNASIRPVADLGFNSTQMEQFLELMNKPQGIMFVTGPTGSGKTTTLYSALGHIQSPSKN